MVTTEFKVGDTIEYTVPVYETKKFTATIHNIGSFGTMYVTRADGGADVVHDASQNVKVVRPAEPKLGSIAKLGTRDRMVRQRDGWVHIFRDGSLGSGRYTWENLHKVYPTVTVLDGVV